MSAEDVKTVQNAYDSFGRGDIPAVLSNFAADAEWVEGTSSSLLQYPKRRFTEAPTLYCA